MLERDVIANLKALKGRASLARLGGWRRLGGLAQRARFLSKKGLQTFSTEVFSCREPRVR